MSRPGDPDPQDRLRSFVAVPLADPARAAVVSYLQGLRATVGGVAWTNDPNLHLTLKFLGDVAADSIPDLAERLRPIVAAIEPFTMRVAGVGAFPSLARPRVLWIGVAAPELVPLAQGVEAVCAAAGFAPEARVFRPHVTLGRVREPRRSRPPDLGLLAADGAREFGDVAVEHVVLFRSETLATGARHTPLATLPLGSARFP